MESRNRPVHDELKVWVDGFQRVVCGINDKTTVQEVVIALAQATGQTGRYTLVERWRNSERLLPPSECPLGILNKWGQYAGDVQFVLRRSPDSKSANNNSNITPPSLKNQTSSSSIQSNSNQSQNFKQYKPISSSNTLPNNISHYNQLRQNSTLSAQALKNVYNNNNNHNHHHSQVQNSSSVLAATHQISAPQAAGNNVSNRHQAHVKKIEHDIEQHARSEYYKVIGGQQTSLDELEAQLTKFNNEISKLDTAIRSYEFKRIHSSSSVTSSQTPGSNFHHRSGSAPLSMEKQPITENNDRFLNKTVFELFLSCLYFLLCSTLPCS